MGLAECPPPAWLDSGHVCGGDSGSADRQTDGSSARSPWRDLTQRESVHEMDKKGACSGQQRATTILTDTRRTLQSLLACISAWSPRSNPIAINEGKLNEL